MKTIKLLCSLFLFILFFSCGKDDAGPIGGCNENFNFALELQEEANALSVAAQAFSLDPTTENCNAYKVAANNYLDAAEELEDCAFEVGQGVEYQAAVDDARDAVNSLQC